jgi:hypothetical protein
VWSLVAAAGGNPAPALLLPEAPAAIISCGDSVRAVQFAPDCQPGASYYLAAGLESGVVQLLSLAVEAGAGGQLAVSGHQLVWQSSDFERHTAAVRRLCWRRDDGGSEQEQGAAPAPPQQQQQQQQRYLLASCSDDHSLRVHSVQL